MPALIVIAIILAVFFRFCGCIQSEISDFVYENQSLFVFIKENYLLFLTIPFFIAGIFFLKVFKTTPKKQISKIPKKDMENIELKKLISQEKLSQDLKAFKKAVKFDITGSLNLLQLAKNLEDNLKQSNPSNCFFIFGGKRQIKRQELNLEQQGLIRSQIYELGMAAEELAETQAKLYLIPTVVDAIIEQREDEIELAKQRLLTQIHKEKAEREAYDVLLIEARAKVQRIYADTKLVELQGKLLEKVTNELDLGNISPEQAFVLVKALNPTAEANVDFASQQLMIETQIEKMKAETQKKIEEGRREKVQRRTDELDLHLAVKEFNK